MVKGIRAKKTGAIEVPLLESRRVFKRERKKMKETHEE